MDQPGELSVITKVPASEEGRRVKPKQEMRHWKQRWE